MKRTLSLAATAVVAMAMPAFAAVITVDTGAPAAGAPPVPAAGTLLATFTPTASDALLATAATTDAEVTALGAIKDVTKVTVRKVTVGSAADAAAVNKVKTDRAADIAKLQAALKANTAFSAELTAKMVDPATVVAMEVAADGTVTLYTLG
jgi:hypothetical protein